MPVPVTPEYTQYQGALIAPFGNSHTYGQGVDHATESYPVKLGQLFNAVTSGVSVPNTLGVPGRTTAQMILDAPSTLFPLYSSSRKCFALINESVNEYYYGASYSQGITDLRTLCKNCRDAGFTVITITNPVAASVPAFLQSLNVYQKTHWAEYADGIIKLDETDLSSYLVSDGLHYNAAGYAMWAQIIFTAMGLMRF